jgi:hypothetical protein
MYIYVLKLENDKYYIGKSKNHLQRIEDHKNNIGSYWTKKYKPLEVIDVFEQNDSFDEDKTTLQYMDLYGIENVRGGAFVQLNISNSQIEFIQKILNSRNDKCFKCGKEGHFVRYCPNKNEKCFLCGKNTHLTDDCDQI